MTKTTTPSKTTQQAEAFIAECAEAGFSVEAGLSVEAGRGRHEGSGCVTIESHFTPGDRAAYVRCDGIAGLLLCGAPTVTYGTTWGTDGASVGGHAGMTGGYYRLSKSGVSKRFVAAILKLQAGR